MLCLLQKDELQLIKLLTYRRRMSKVLMYRLSYVNWLQYAWGALMVNHFQGKDIVAYGDQEILEYYSLENASKWAYVGYEALIVLFFLTLCWIALTAMRHQKR